MHWREKPALFPTLFFLMGMVSCALWRDLPSHWMPLLLALLWLAIVALSNQPTTRGPRVMLLALGFFLCGYLNLHVQIPSPLWLQEYTQGKIQARLVVQEHTPSSGAWSQYRCNLLHPYPVKIGLMLRVPKDSLFLPFAHGDTVTLEGHLNTPPRNPNPTLFDYGDFLRSKGIYLQSYVKTPEQILAISPSKSKKSAWVETLQSKIIDQLKLGFENPEDLAFQKAILIGKSSDLSPEIKESFRKSGAIHVLAISGLHVGILTAMVSKILEKIGKKKYPLLQLLIQLLVLWVFVFTAGAKPSALRAGIVFTAYAVAEKSHRTLDPLQALSLAALLILLIQPLQILDLGFQLSFAAVLGIVLFFQPLSQLMTTPNKILKFVWEGLALAISAQAATLPILLYNFKEISTVFWLSGLLVVPLMGLLLPCSLLYLLISFFLPPLIPLSSGVCKALMWAMTHINEKLAQLSWAYLEGLPFDGVDLLLLMALLFTLLAPLSNRRNLVSLSLALATLLFAYEGGKNWALRQQEWILQYADERQFLLQWTQGTTYALMADKPLNYPLSQALQYQKTMKRTQNLSSETYLAPDEKFHWSLKNLHWTNHCPSAESPSWRDQEIEYLFWWGPRSKPALCLFENIQFSTLVLPMGLSKKARQQWEELAFAYQRNLIFQDEQGPFYYSFKQSISPWKTKKKL
jgi:ComEC/Rec2-related protein